MKTLNLGPMFFTNCYIVDGLNKSFIVDPGSNLELIKSNITKEVDFILLTHGHVDHIGLIHEFNCPIYIHEADYDCLFSDGLSLYAHMNKKRPFDPNKLNIIKLKDNDIINFENKEIKVIHTPGHTKGSACYLYKDKLFSGDTLFANSMGRTDFPTGSETDMKKSLVSLIDNLPDTIKVYPGHGEKTTIHDERISNYYYLHFKKQR